jgi:hypothetical protein
MKRMLAVLMGICIVVNLQAQTWEEWFKQKETQIRYLVEQVAALRMYGSTVQKGYEVVNGGLKDISLLKKDDLILHQGQFASLLLVKPGVRNSGVVHRFISLHTSIMSIYRECKGRVRRDNEFSKEENAYFTGVLENIVRECKAAGEEALLLISDGQFQMCDGERLKRLQTLSGTMKELYVFLRQFRNNISIAALNRLNELKGIKKLKSLY